MIRINGNYLEGGGQIVRTALALSCLTQQPFEIHDIRAGRAEGGLKAQHVSCVRVLEQLCGAKVEGAEIGSSKLVFRPGFPRGGSFKVDIGTAGSVTLLLQSVLLPAFFADKDVTFVIKGGTDVSWSMPWDYFVNVLVPYLTRFGGCEAKLVKRGYYPVGGGEVRIRIKPGFSVADFDSWKSCVSNVVPFNLVKRPKISFVKGVSHASSSLAKRRVAERQAESARIALSDASIISEYCDTFSDGSGIVLWAGFGEDSPVILGSDCLGASRLSSEQVGSLAASNFLKVLDSDACVDAYLADNLIPWMGLAKKSVVNVFEVSKHTLTNIYVTELFLGKCFSVKNKIIST